VCLLATLAVTLSLFAVLIYTAVSGSLYRHHDLELGRQASELAAVLTRNGIEPAAMQATLGQVSPRPSLVQISSADGEPLFGEPSPWTDAEVSIPGGACSDEFFTTALPQIGDVRFTCLPLDGGRRFLRIGEPLGDIDAALATVAVYSVVLVPLVLLLAGLVAGTVVHRGLAPVRGVAATLEAIEATALARRIDVNPGDRDLALLVSTLNHMLDRLQQAFERAREFAGDVSHQVQTPLTVITAELGAIASDSDPAKNRRRLESAREEVDSIRTLVASLGSLALSDAPVPDAALVDLSGLVTEVSDVVAALGEVRGVVVRHAVQPGVTVRGDMVRLRQVLLNLADNAVKYTDAGGRVTIDLTTEGDHAVLRVTDTGIGISDEHLPRLFDRMFRVERHRGTDAGMGLGLAIVRRIVEAHHGTIDVRSQPDAGSTFTVRLPLGSATVGTTATQS